MERARSETLGGFAMLAAAAAAMLWANSPWSDSYEALITLPAAVSIGDFELRKSLAAWITDGLMAVFFLLAGLEIKREVIAGELSSRARIALPAAAALGGMIVPALLFYLCNRGQLAGLRGWAIPCATDIAFSLAVLRLVGRRTPQSLRILLTAVAVLDDIGAIVIIAIFYTEQLSLAMLLAALVPIGLLIALNRARVASVAPYVLAGVALWLCVLKSGIHATLAGVITAAAIPKHTRRGSLLDKTEHSLVPWVSLLILPVFAFASAGVSLADQGGAGFLKPVAIGAALGLLIGKPVGIALGVVAVVGAGWAAIPSDATRRQIAGVATLCGIGFTMSLLLASLAFESQAPPLFQQAKLGILAGSALAAGLGVWLLGAARQVRVATPALGWSRGRR